MKQLIYKHSKNSINIKSILALSFFLSACQMQNSNDTLDYVTDDLGQNVTSFNEIYSNPTRDFGIRDEEGIETVERNTITQSSATKPAVIVSNKPLDLKENHRSSSPLTGYTLDPLTEVKAFWPTHIANDNIEILWTDSTGTDVRGWLKYIDEEGNTLVNFLEDFVIESVTLSGAKIITPDEATGSIHFEISPTVNATEEVITLEPTAEEVTLDSDESTNTPPELLETEDVGVTATEEDQSPRIRPQARPIVESDDEEVQETPAEIVEDETPNLRPRQRPSGLVPEEDSSVTSAETTEDSNDETTIINTRSSPHPDQIIPDEEEEHDHNHDDPEDSLIDEDATDAAVLVSLRPMLRPTDLVTTITDDEYEDIIDQLGLRQIPIPFSLSMARGKIEGITRAQRFSGCSFRPNIGNNYSGRDCYRDLILANDFVEFLEDHAHQCSVDAALEAFNKRPVLIQYSTNAGSINRSNANTLHYRGRALDLFTATLYWSTDEDDKRTVRLHKNHTDGSSQTERQNHEYYWAFVDCWKEKVRIFKPNSCGASTRAGALTYRFNQAHHNHIHLALPLSNTERNRHSLNCI